MKFFFFASAFVVSGSLLLSGCSSQKELNSSGELTNDAEIHSRKSKIKPLIAIDGHAGSGKSTLVEKLADRFNLAYLDAGLLYRYAAHRDLTPEDMEKLTVVEVIDGLKKIPPEILQSEQVGTKAAVIAKRPETRKSILRLEREFIGSTGSTQYRGTIMAGRDIATVVAPDAACKLFVTADLKKRAARRLSLQKKKNPNATFEEVYSSMKERDYQDENRKESPLICDSRYTVIDTSNKSAEESFEEVSAIVADVLSKYSDEG
jgi:cytidylate kinase